jgi:hypothetical protein
MGRVLKAETDYDRRHPNRWQAGATAQKLTRQREMKL